MPVKLGLSAAGAATSALSGSGKAGPTSTQNQVGTNSNVSSATQSGGNTQTPNLNPLMTGFQSSLVPALSSLYAKAQTPVYGAQQIAQVANAGDAATDAAQKSVAANAARSGVLNSGQTADANTALAAGNTANTVGFENNIPLLNYQNEMAQTGNVLNLAENLTGKALSTSTGTASNIGSSNSLTNSNNTLTQSGPAFGSSMLGALGNGLTAGGGAGKGGGSGKSGGGGGGNGGGSTSPTGSIIPGAGVFDSGIPGVGSFGS